MKHFNPFQRASAAPKPAMTARELRRRSRALDGTHKVGLPDLLPDAFIRARTSFGSLREMLEAGGVTTNADLATAAWDTLVATRTEFEGWLAMMEAAALEWGERQLMGGHDELH